MKKSYLTIGAVALFGLATITSQRAFGQDTVTTTTSTGTVSTFSPDAVAVKVSTSAEPVRYSFTKTTTYVDENGNPVSVATVRSGAPVVVYYEKNDIGFVADKVVVKKSVSTTTDSVPTVPPVAAPQSGPPSVDGVVSDADSDEISLRTDSPSGPAHYQAHDSTAYVDEAGNPVSKASVKEGTPVTIFFERDGDNLRATRVVVRSTDSTVTERKTTTTTTQDNMNP